MAKWGVKNITPNWLRDDLPKGMFYEVFASNMRYQMSIELS